MVPPAPAPSSSGLTRAARPPADNAVLAALAALVPAGQFFKFYQSFSNSLQTACYILAFAYYLVHEDLIAAGVVSEQLGGALPM